MSDQGFSDNKWTSPSQGWISSCLLWVAVEPINFLMNSEVALQAELDDPLTAALASMLRHTAKCWKQLTELSWTKDCYCYLRSLAEHTDITIFNLRVFFATFNSTNDRDCQQNFTFPSCHSSLDGFNNIVINCSPKAFHQCPIALPFVSNVIEI